jgi:hypothetical protein
MTEIFLELSFSIVASRFTVRYALPLFFFLEQDKIKS